LRILVTRSQRRAADTAGALRARGHEPVIAPLFAMERLADVDPASGPWDGILLTSANGLWGIVSFAHDKKWHGIPVFAIGDATAKAARDMHFADVTSASGNVDDLLNLIAARLQPPAKLLYLAGEERAGDIAGALRGRNFEVELVVVYRFLTAQFLPEPAAAALESGLDGVLHFSPASAEGFLNAARNSNLLDAALNKPVHFCLSEQVAAPLRKANAARIQIAGQPTQDALLDLCG
jgi:uroporphyrinogen-III synthase